MSREKMNNPAKLDDQENEALRKDFGRRLREIRGFYETQKQFAEKLGITQSMLSRLEKGYTDPPLKILIKLSEVSGKSIDELVKG
jgi:transcriptional regulator with XRE-family HTH domain